jgi:ubiquinone/menaquinone biosynthesis C-methylase UbiE
MLKRVIEAEAMDTLEEALDYNSMDHAEVNRIFVDDLCAAGLDPDRGEILDLGTGTALIPIQLCRRVPQARVLAVDVAEHMLSVGRHNLQKTGLSERIRLELVDCKWLPYADGQFFTVISNSILHHLADPSTVINEAWRVTAPGGLIFFRDLFRPDNELMLHYLVETYTMGANPVQRQMYEDSLRASLSVEEARELISRLGVAPESVKATSDRHWTWTARKHQST